MVADRSRSDPGPGNLTLDGQNPDSMRPNVQVSVLPGEQARLRRRLVTGGDGSGTARLEVHGRRQHETHGRRRSRVALAHGGRVGHHALREGADRVARSLALVCGEGSEQSLTSNSHLRRALCRQVRASPNERSTQRRRLDAKMAFQQRGKSRQEISDLPKPLHQPLLNAKEVLSARWQPICRTDECRPISDKYMKRRIANNEMSPGGANLVMSRRGGHGFWFVVQTTSLANERRSQSFVRTLRVHRGEPQPNTFAARPSLQSITS